MSVQVLPEYLPSAIGGACFATGAARRPNERVVDIGVGVDNSTPNGDIFLSESFCKEIAHAIGFLDPSAIRHSQEYALEQQRISEKASAAWAACRNTLNALVELMLIDPVSAAQWARIVQAQAAALPVDASELTDEQADIGTWLGTVPPPGNGGVVVEGKAPDRSGVQKGQK